MDKDKSIDLHTELHEWVIKASKEKIPSGMIVGMLEMEKFVVITSVMVKPK